MSTAPNYTHKGVDIFFGVQTAKFTAVVGTKMLKAPSLDAIKKKIDAEQAVAFQPFKAVSHSGGTFTSFNVTHIGTGEGRGSRGDVVFITDHPNRWSREQHYVTPDTPENRAALAAADARYDELSKQIDALADELDRLRMSIPTVTPATYTKACQ